jgi:hypothetical protein
MTVRAIQSFSTGTTVQVVGLERPERLEINAIAVIP